MSDEKYIIGLDFGTDSVRALLVNAANGREETTAEKRQQAIFGVVAADYYKSVEEAQRNLASGFSTIYSPIPENVKIYERLYNLYIDMGTKLEDFLRKL